MPKPELLTRENFIARAERAAQEIEGHGMLEAYAAKAAAGELINSWRDAVRDGTEPRDLLPDIDRTVSELVAFRRYILSGGLTQ